MKTQDYGTTHDIVELFCYTANLKFKILPGIIQNIFETFCAIENQIKVR